MYRLAGLVICIDKFGCSCFSAEPAGCDCFFSANVDVQTLNSPRKTPLLPCQALPLGRADRSVFTKLDFAEQLAW